MKRKSNLIGNVEVTRDLKFLLFIGGLYSLSVALSNTFVNIFLWKQSEQYVDIALYNLAIVVLQPLTFILAGRWAKKVDRVIVLRIGVIFLAFFYLAVLISGAHAANYLLLLGGLLGIGYGFYWLAFNVLTFEITEPETRDFFNGFLGVLSSVGGMIGPISAGFIISRFEQFTGYSLVFGLSLFLFSIAVFLSFFIKRRPSEGLYLFTKIVRYRSENTNWRLVTNAHFAQGLRDGLFAFVISVFVFITTGSEFALGTFGLVNSGIAFLSYYFISRFVSKYHRKKAIFTGGFLLFASLSLLIFQLTFIKLLIYAAVIAIAYPLVLVPYISITYDVIGQSWRAAEMRIEYIVVRELFLHAGRIVSIGVFLMGLFLFNEKQMMPYILVLLGSSYLFIYLFIRKVEF